MQYLIYHLNFERILDPDTRFNKKERLRIRNYAPTTIAFTTYKGILVHLRDFLKTDPTKGSGSGPRLLQYLIYLLTFKRVLGPGSG